MIIQGAALGRGVAPACLWRAPAGLPSQGDLSTKALAPGGLWCSRIACQQSLPHSVPEATLLSKSSISNGGGFSSICLTDAYVHWFRTEAKMKDTQTPPQATASAADRVEHGDKIILGKPDGEAGTKPALLSSVQLKKIDEHPFPGSGQEAAQTVTPERKETHEMTCTFAQLLAWGQRPKCRTVSWSSGGM